MLSEQDKDVNEIDNTLGAWIHSAEGGTFAGVGGSVEEINLPGQLLPGDRLRLSNMPNAMPQLIRELRKMQGMIQAELGESIGYPAPVIGNIE